MMMKARKPIAILAAAIAAATMSAALVAPAAGASESEPVTSSRSFKGQQSRSADLLKESTSVEVKDNANYGGIESLNVPKTESKAEKEAKAKAEAEKKAQEEAAKQAAAQEAAAQSASRSSERTSTSESSSTGASSSTADAGSVTVPAGSDFVKRALAVIGSGYQPSGYVWTGSTSTSSFTCSGLVDFALGYPSNSNWPEKYYAMVSNKTTDISQLKYGDLVFFHYAGRSPGHVGIYLGNGMMVDSAPGGGVQVRGIGSSFMGGGTL
ncbi:NlpC/P60 family protein [Bifidobacterium primatium]|nr:NlpC/P60 family protein [Bifidobacterium primatium]